MKRRIQKHFQSATALIILASMLLFMASGFAYLHVHVVDGKLIAHSHPTSSSQSTPEHTHSKTEYYFYNLMNGTNPFTITPYFVLLLISLLVNLAVIALHALIPRIIIGNFLNRAPPFLFFLLSIN
jgi:hypothetical protein